MRMRSKLSPKRETNRLFHTLVLSSLTLGCSETHLRSIRTDDASVDTGPGDDAVAERDAGVDAFDPRYCEPGWPTTKGAPRVVCVDADGLVRAESEVPCESRVLCELGTVREIGERFEPSCCLLPPGTP
jgi:hypothetical protein